MNRTQAGLFAVGALVVALAIVIVGTVSYRSQPPASKAAADSQAESQAQSAMKDRDTTAGAVAGSSGSADEADNAAVKPDSAKNAGNDQAAGPPSTDAQAANQGDKSSSKTPAETAEMNGSQASRQSASVPPSADTRKSTGAHDTATDDIGLPTFDIVRVEPDGSTLIAGHAEPESQVHVMNGATRIATADADETGDFVALLDKPLTPGNYELALRSVGKNKDSKSSSEVATISVPKVKGSQLLAMISKPGQASRLVTVPEPESLPPPKPGEIGNGSPATPEQDVATRETTTLDDKKGARSEAGVPAVGGRPAAATPATAAPELRVEAVEIEGDSVYVAGSAPPGSTVRVYADDAFVGAAEATADGRFVVNRSMSLAPGRHMIRADLIGPDGGTVVVRATVPFDRPDESGRFAAVAPGGQETRPSPAVSRLDSEATQALADLDAKIQAETPSADAIEKARRRTEASLRALTGSSTDDTATGAVRNGADEAVRKKASAALEQLKQLPLLSMDSELTPDQLSAMRSSVKGATDTMKAQGGTRIATADGAKTVVQPALTQSNSFVIIRRGDNLWQISRRVYGRGIRYTTIYLANNGEISDPNVILPGQVFDLPGKPSSTLDQAEQLHRKLLREERRK